MFRKGSTQGFTLIELMITIVLLSIVAAIALPNYTQYTRNAQLQTKAEELRKFLVLARNLAIDDRAQMKLVFSESAPWEIQRPSLDNLVLHKLEQNQAKAKLVALSDSGAAITELLFRPSGVASAPASFTVCHDNKPKTGYLVSVERSGAIRMHPQGKKADNTTDLTTCQ